MEPPPYKLYTVGQVVLAAFLGSPLPGMWMVARNQRVLGLPAEARKSLGWAFGLTILCLSLAFIVPDNCPATAVSLPFVLAVRSLAQRALQGPLAQHAANGGRLGSWWAAVGWGLLALVCIVALIFGIVLLLPDME